jgi:hypothetical protein
MSKPERYRQLALLYKFDPETIANMPPFVQAMMLDEKGRHTDDVMLFDTMDEYLIWRSGTNGR